MFSNRHNFNPFYEKSWSLNMTVTVIFKPLMQSQLMQSGNRNKTANINVKNDILKTLTATRPTSQI